MPLSPDRLATVTDEVLADPAAAVRRAATWGLRRFELRGLTDGRRAPDLSADEIVALHAALDTMASRLVGLSPGLGKPRAGGEPDASRLARTLALARRFDVGSITAFAPPRGTPLDVAASMLRQWRDAAAAEGVELLVENSAATCAGTCDEVVDLLTRVPGLRLVWDPANAAAAGDRLDPDAVRRLLLRVARVHVKSVLPAGPCVDVGDGLVDWPQQLRLLDEAGYRGLLTIEPHQPDAVERNARLLLAMSTLDRP
jgi:sugar phosphate isomerase/epimerase